MSAFVKDAADLTEEEYVPRTERRDVLRGIESKVREFWRESKTFEEDAPDPSKGEDANQGKFFTTFPYPYMNGRIHLGHAFTITKADFSAGYQRLKGKRVLFPFAFHCTGMPIQAAANKLRNEIEQYGVERLMAGEFDAIRAEKAAAAAPATKAADDDLPVSAASKAKGSKTKLVAKTGGKKKLQWEILLLCDVPSEEIPDFVDPLHWLRYFPPYGRTDLELFGLHVDWRRSFITTDVNPMYDSFIRWQFRKLKEAQKIDFGKRPTIYSVTQGQACMDHARASGEGVGMTEYTLIKLRLFEDGVDTLVSRSDHPGASQLLDAKARIYLVAATLRPETMYGQTNCFVLPDGEYGAYRIASGDIFVCSDHAAQNFAHQCDADGNPRMAEWGVKDLVCPLSGRQLLGLPLSAPNATYDRVYTLPLLTISMGKGTGVVTSVPSDAPDDYAALRDLQRDAALRDEYGITEEMVAGYEPVPIIQVPGACPELKLESWGDMAAVTACLKLKVRDQHDAGKLGKIKKLVYKAGFYAGVLTVGSQAGKSVEVAKTVVKQELIDSGDACRYWEPESQIISRNGDECIVAHIDQWYLKYGEPEWRDKVLAHVQASEPAGESKGETSAASADGASAPFRAFGMRHEYVNTLNWLGNWACSRSFGLGTRVPWDEQFVIESLSDSTIYMAYYTVAHMLQGPDNFDGTKVGPAGITADQLNDAVWDYIFKQGAYPDGCTIPEATLQTLRREFEYWYPLDLRVSGKDLVRNHLTMALYNHAAIWPDQPDKWPRGYFTNGHVGVDGEKMSKQLGNFITAYGAMATNNVHFNQKEGKWKSQSWSTDTVRLALANAGDTMSDANFKSDIADKEILGLLNELDWMRENLAAAKAGQLRTGDKLTVEDQVFHIAMDACINEADQMYEAMKFSLAVKACYYDLMNARNTYRSYFALSGGQMHEALVRRYVDTFIVMLSPICTHICEYIWRDVLGRNGSVTRAPWPTLSGQDHACLQMSNFVQQTLARFTKQLFGKKKKKKKSKKNAGQDTATADLPPTHGIIYVQPEYPEWKQIVMKWVDAQWDDSIEGGLDKKAVMKGVRPAFQDNEVVQAAGKMVNKFLGYLVSVECRQRGRAALQTQPPFDEMVVLQEQMAYLCGSLRLSGGLQIVRVGDPAAPVPAEPRILENAEPGNPVLWAYRG